MNLRLNFVIWIAFLLPFFIDSCSVSYSFTGASISSDVRTFSVYDFPNRAKLVNPNLSQTFMDQLQELLLKQTSLNQLPDGGDLEFSGQITGYEMRPVNIQEGDLAAQNRLTVTIKVKYVNNTDHDQDWEKSFSHFVDYSSESALNDVEDDLVEEIVKQIAEDIYNASIANW